MKLVGQDGGVHSDMGESRPNEAVGNNQMVDVATVAVVYHCACAEIRVAAAFAAALGVVAVAARETELALGR